jgi:hypothetical protein
MYPTARAKRKRNLVLVHLTDRILTDKNFDRQNFDRQNFDRQEFSPTEFSPTRILTDRILTDKNFDRQNIDRQEFSPNMEFFLIQIVFPILLNQSSFENQRKFSGKIHFCISILSFFQENCLIFLEIHEIFKTALIENFWENYLY